MFLAYLGIIKNGNLFVREPQSQVRSLIIEYLLVLSYAVFINEMRLFATFSYFSGTKKLRLKQIWAIFAQKWGSLTKRTPKYRGYLIANLFLFFK
ncbi:hypothetical protein DW047_12615 [Phocaeicola vulgatus]|nr:hypothetical protein DW047_12615 [Phocaeicola vulgatus]